MASTINSRLSGGKSRSDEEELGLDELRDVPIGEDGRACVGEQPSEVSNFTPERERDPNEGLRLCSNTVPLGELVITWDFKTTAGTRGTFIEVRGVDKAFLS